MAREGWLCPSCGGAHAPDVQSCPQPLAPNRNLPPWDPPWERPRVLPNEGLPDFPRGFPRVIC